MKKVVLGLSGGVDSSVAAFLLKQKGYHVIGLFMKNWHDDTVTISDECPWLDDSNDAMLVAQTLDIPFQTVDLSKEYKVRIVDYMFDEYKRGRTPNPDILCNREIKFDVFLKIALSLGADFVATGHYCRKSVSYIEENAPIYSLRSGLDTNKDQSYFLCQLSQAQLAKTLFPIGELQKSEVRAIASKLKLVTADKKDSQGLCFIGKVRLPDFLQQQLKPKKGMIIQIPSDFKIYHKPLPIFESKVDALLHQSQPIVYESEDGAVVGTHQGAHFFTKGQRKGLAVGGTKAPLFVIETDVNKNIIYVGEGKEHPGLYRSTLRVENEAVHWLRHDLKLSNGEQLKVLARIRYRQSLEPAVVFQTKQGLFVEFSEKQTAIMEGQFVAWYIDDELVGSGVIS
jgi:tRNA-specific 2-thiouridylase